MATTDMTDIATKITISDGTPATTVVAEVTAAFSDGTFGTALVDNSDTSSVLATATVEEVAAIEDGEGDEVLESLAPRASPSPIGMLGAAAALLLSAMI